jgi:hypothetical protein
MKNNYHQNQNNTISIELAYGKLTVISKEDFQRVDSYPGTWGLAYDSHVNNYYVHGYVYEEGKKKTVCLHRFILGVSDRKQLVDHINHDTLNNTRENLRVVNNSINGHNIKGPAKNNSTGYSGVTFKKQYNKFVARINNNGKAIHLGYFVTPEKAYEAYLNAKATIDPLAALLA